MTDQMHDGKCNELLVREETIHGRGPAKAVYIPNLLPSLRFLRLVIFFALLLAVARAAVPQPPSHPNYHPHTDRQAADGETRCVHEEIQFSDETNVLHQGGCVAVLRERGRGGGPGSNAVLDRLGPARTGFREVEVVQVVSGCKGVFIKIRFSLFSCIYLFIYSIIYPFIYSVPQMPPLAADSKTGSLPLPENKNTGSQEINFKIFKEKYRQWTQ